MNYKKNRGCVQCGALVNGGARRLRCEECQDVRNKEIQRKNRRAWSIANRKRSREHNRAYRLRHPERAKASSLKWRSGGIEPAPRQCLVCETPLSGRKKICDGCSRERNKARCLAYHATHKPDAGKVKASWDKWRAANPDKDRAAKVAGRSRYLALHPERRAASVAKYAAKKRQMTAAKRAIIPVAALKFPYVIAARPDILDYLALNALVPAGLPGREDAVQDMALAVLEGRTTLDALQADHSTVRAFCRSHMKGNFESGGYAVSLSEPRRDGRNWNDVLAAPAP